MAKRSNKRADSGGLGRKPENGGAPAIAPVKVVPIDSLQPNPWNPNVEDAQTFNDLVENIKENGFTGAVEVAEVEPGVYRIIGGEHRWKAAKLAGLREIPISLVPWDEDLQKLQTVRLNVIRGKMDPRKFTELFLELERKYGRDEVRKRMGLGQKDALFRQLLKNVKKSLPEVVQLAIEKRADKIRNVEDLAAVVNTIYSQHGGSLTYSFMVFSFAGRSHIMVKLTDTNFKKLKAILSTCEADNIDVNDYFNKLLS